ncbi:USP8, partial [Symbiodinium microadriaticum]
MIGLKNLGNTCFLNSSLQCLVNTIPLMDYFAGFDWKREINLSNPIGTGGVIAEQFGYLVDTMWDSRVSSSISPTSFKRALGTFWPQFSGYDQHDAQELLAFLLDGLHEDLNRVVNKPYVEDVESDNREPAEVAVESWKAYLLRNRSIIVDIFQGQLRNVLCCLDCKYTSYKFDPFMYMSVPIPKGRQVHLHDCLDEFCRPEILSQGCQWNCPKCKVSRDAEKKMDVWIAPPVFIVHLKRFQDNSMGRRSKMDTLVTFPTRRLDLSKFMHSNQPGSHVYDLYAVSNHHGNMIQGHYTAYVKNRLNRKWCLYNDASVTAVKENDVCTNSAYVLFYHK